VAERPCAVREDQAWELLAYLTASAELCTTEPHYYGTFRLIEAASRLIAFMLADSEAAANWLRDFKSEIDEKKLWMLRDRDAYFAFLREAAATLATHMSTEAETGEQT
jgi:hypothetical protein